MQVQLVPGIEGGAGGVQAGGREDEEGGWAVGEAAEVASGGIGGGLELFPEFAKIRNIWSIWNPAQRAKKSKHISD